MDQNIDNRYKEILWDLLANPAENGQLYKQNLQRLVQDNPQSGLLQVMHARSLQKPDIRTASAYFSPKVLHKLMHDPDGLLPVSRDRINKHLNGNRPEAENYFNIGQVTETEPEHSGVISENPVAEAESMGSPDYAHLVDKITPVEEMLPAHEEPQLLPEHEEAPTFHAGINEVVTEPEPSEQNYFQQPPALPDPYYPVVEMPEPSPAYQPAAVDDDDDEFANPWDFSKLEQPGEIVIPVQQTEEAPEPLVETKPEPPVEYKPEPVAETAPEPLVEYIPEPAAETTPEPLIDYKPEPVAETTPEPLVEYLSEPGAEEAPKPVVEGTPEPITEYTPEHLAEEELQPEPAAEAAPVQEEFKIETSDHPLSAFEEHAVQQAAVEEQPEEPEEEVSSFNHYTENVFHNPAHIEDEVYEEIVSIDEIGVESLGNTFAEGTPSEEAQTEAPEADEETSAQQQGLIADETEKLIYGNIAATDYLSFDKKLDELRAGIVSKPAGEEQQSAAQYVSEPQVAPVQQEEQPVTEVAPAQQTQPEPETPAPGRTVFAEAPAQQQLAEGAKEPEIVSKYDDETLPYSFLWWLDKTRKEHAGTTRPYAAGATKISEPTPANNSRKPTDELQQQYFANIFSLTSVSSIGDIEPPKVAFDPEKKEDVIIERFIHNDPQIKPLAADKLDNENKARRSAEDQDAMATETLARIYGDQMLYHKAIATYKKLMLKIPEKKTYFAAQIEQLEKKIN